MANIELRGISKLYGDHEIIKHLDLDIRNKEFTVFVGPSGCGKSTLLRMIAGLEEITSGDILIDGQRVNDVPASKRGLALVFQSYALYPHMSVADNMSFALKLAGVPKAERDAKVRVAAEILHIEDLLERKPKELSGGQRQRVAIGRAIVRNPRVFLFDEPLSNLDAALRVRMRVELAKLHRELSATMIYVTHDQIEAMTMADRIVVLRSGNIEQVGTPMELYHSPCNLFVAGFIGSPKMNVLEAEVMGRDSTNLTLRLGTVSLQYPCTANLPAGSEVTVGIRPEHLVLAPNGLQGRAVVVEHLGSESFVQVELDTKEIVTVRLSGETKVKLDQLVELAIPPHDIHVFDSSGAAIPNTNKKQGQV